MKLFMLLRWDKVSKLRPTVVLLFILQVMYKYGEPRRNDIDRRNRKTREQLVQELYCYQCNLLFSFFRELIIYVRTNLAYSPSNLTGMAFLCGIKCKAVPQHTCGGPGGEDVWLLLIHNLGTKWGKWSASRPGRALPPGKRLPVLIG
jgi:hypothetical protein